MKIKRTIAFILALLPLILIAAGIASFAVSAISERGTAFVSYDPEDDRRFEGLHVYLFMFSGIFVLVCGVLAKVLNKEACSGFVKTVSSIDIAAGVPLFLIAFPSLFMWIGGLIVGRPIKLF